VRVAIRAVTWSAIADPFVLPDSYGVGADGRGKMSGLLAAIRALARLRSANDGNAGLRDELEPRENTASSSPSKNIGVLSGPLLWRTDRLDISLTSESDAQLIGHHERSTTAKTSLSRSRHLATVGNTSGRKITREGRVSVRADVSMHCQIGSESAKLTLAASQASAERETTVGQGQTKGA